MLKSRHPGFQGRIRFVQLTHAGYFDNVGHLDVRAGEALCHEVAVSSNLGVKVFQDLGNVRCDEPLQTIGEFRR